MIDITKVFVKESMMIGLLYLSEEIGAFFVFVKTAENPKPQSVVFHYANETSGASKDQALCSASQHLQSFL